MRIAHVTATFPPYLAGTGYVARYQALELARLGHEVHVFTVKEPGSRETGRQGNGGEGVVLHRLPAAVRVGNAPVLPGLLRLPPFDLVHLHYPFISGAEFTWLSCRRRKMPYVVNYHNDLIGVGLRQAIFQFYNRAFGGLVLGQAARILAVTRDHALNCRATPIFLKYKRQIEELNNGVETDHFHPGWDGQAWRAKIGIPGAATVILFVGALDRAHHFKGVSVLLEAFQRLGRWRFPARQDAWLVIAGDGDLRASYQREAANRQIEKRVRFVGGIPHANLPACYAAADLLVLPSSPPESFGMVIIEAMACGKPVIGSRIPGVRSLIDEGVDGLLCEPGDPAGLASRLDALLDLPAERRAQMGQAGRRKAEERFSWRGIARKLEAIYCQVIDG